ncbi:unnamed protein product [Moneuplotes crassus]|uniref:Uncharacterized protein n=1 Tax=Euplotes crassus TaxID=5936 RepID=A0AAD1U7Y9_EUPCR|nr:unnamed protein product [Moneuplotes crassus]
MENKGDPLDTLKRQEIKKSYHDYKINNVIKNVRNSAYNDLCNEEDTLNAHKERNKSQRVVCNHPDELLSEISDILLDLKVSSHFMGEGEAVNWKTLSKSILNKFSINHKVLNHQVDALKIQKQDIERENKERDNFKKFRTKKANKINEIVPISSTNGFQKLIEEKQRKRERFYSDNPQMLKLAELQDSHDINKLQFRMIINGMKQDRKGNYILHCRGTTQSNPQYRKVKSKLRNYTNAKSMTRKSPYLYSKYGSGRSSEVSMNSQSLKTGYQSFKASRKSQRSKFAIDMGSKNKNFLRKKAHKIRGKSFYRRSPITQQRNKRGHCILNPEYCNITNHKKSLITKESQTAVKKDIGVFFRENICNKNFEEVRDGLFTENTLN